MVVRCLDMDRLYSAHDLRTVAEKLDHLSATFEDGGSLRVLEAQVGWYGEIGEPEGEYNIVRVTWDADLGEYMVGVL